jgi:hypothetical protein
MESRHARLTLDGIEYELSVKSLEAGCQALWRCLQCGYAHLCEPHESGFSALVAAETSARLHHDIRHRTVPAVHFGASKGRALSHELIGSKI